MRPNRREKMLCVHVQVHRLTNDHHTRSRTYTTRRKARANTRTRSASSVRPRGQRKILPGFRERSVMLSITILDRVRVLILSVRILPVFSFRFRSVSFARPSTTNGRRRPRTDAPAIPLRTRLVNDHYFTLIR